MNEPFPTDAVRVALRAIIRWAMQPDQPGEAVGGRVTITPAGSATADVTFTTNPGGGRVPAKQGESDG